MLNKCGISINYFYQLNKLHTFIQTKYDTNWIIYLNKQTNINYKLKLKIIKTLKLNQNQILKLNNQIYIPFLIHNLPNYYNKINLKYILKLNSIIYINKTQIKNKQYIDLLNYSNLNQFSNK